MLSAEGQGSETGVGNLLERALQVTHEAVGVGTIDDLVIEGQRSEEHTSELQSH